MKKQLFTFVACVFYSVLVSAQEKSVTVIDKVNLKPLNNVKLITKKSETPIYSSVEGIIPVNEMDSADSLWFLLPGYNTVSITYSQLVESKFKVSMSEKAYDLDEIVVSASKFQEKRKDVPFQVEIIKSTDIQNMNQQTSADVLQNTGNVMVQKSQQGGGSPILRGFEASRVLMVIDGVRLNNAIYRAGHLQNVITMDNTIMDRIEVVYGPGSTIYGSDALGGVMHFHTRNPLLSATQKGKVNANAFTRFSTANMEKTGHVDFNLGWNKFASLTSFTFSDFGDLRMGNSRNLAYGDWGKRLMYSQTFNGRDSAVVNPDANIQVGSGYKQYDLLQKFLYKQNDKVSHILNFQYSNSRDVPRYDRLTQMSGANPRFGEWYYGPQKRLMAAYNLLLTNDKGIYDQARIILAYQNIEESRNSRRFRKVYLDSQIEKLDIISLNADFSKQIKKNELRYGIEGLYNKVNSSAHTRDIVMDTTAKISSRYPDGGSDYKSFAAYINHTYEASEELIITDGLRYTNVNLSSTFNDTTFFPFPYKSYTQKNSALTGSLGLIFKPAADWRFNLTGSTGFRAPNVDDLSKVFESVSGTIVVPNPNIKPEYTYNVDLGIQKIFAKKVSLNVVGYYTWYKNFITTQPGTFNGKDSIVYDGSLSAVVMSKNSTDAFVCGGTAILAADVTSNFSITSSVNYTYGRIKTDTTDYPLDHVAPVYGKTSFILKVNRFRGEFYTMYSGWKNLKDYNMLGEDNFPNATAYGMPAWMTLNVRASYQIVKQLQLQMALENITDQHYRVFASNISAPGRNFVITLRGSF